MEEKIIKRKILFVICGLGIGGSEKVFVNIVNNIGNNIQPIAIILGERKDFANELKSDIEAHFLNKKNRWDNLRIFIQLCSIIKKKKPDIIMSFGYLANQFTLLARYL